MARLIVKSPYIKCGGGKSAGGYLKYIATRERVEIIPDDRPPTRKQEQFIAKLVKDFPDAKESMEYEDYAAHPTKANASALITLTLETNWDKLSSIDGYAGYIAMRPRAERLGEHGLFGDDDNVDLNRVMMVGTAMSGGGLLLRGEEKDTPTAVSAKGVPSNQERGHQGSGAYPYKQNLLRGHGDAG